MTIKQNGGIFGRNPTFNDIETDGTITSSGDIIANSKVRIEAATNITLQMKDTDGGFAASYLLVENGGRDLSIFAPQDIIFDQDGAETARFRDGGGLCFNGDTAAANALDDYEEGTWTPAFSGGDYSFTYNKQKGSYTKIGNRVYVDCVLYIHPSTAPSGTVDGNLTITGLPYTFNKQNDVEFVGGIIHFKQLFMTSAEAIGYRLSDGETSLLMYDTLATTYPELAYVQASDVNANSRIRLQFSYPTNG